MGRRKQHCPKKSSSDENEAGNKTESKNFGLHLFNYSDRRLSWIKK